MNTKNGEKELERLAAEIRKLGDPYVSPEPSQQYWAGFRMRAMDRIQEKESQLGLVGRAKEWFAGHLLGSGLVGAAIAAAIAVAIINPFGSAPSMKQPESAQSIRTPQTTAPSAISNAPSIAEAPLVSTPEQSHLRSHASAQHDTWMAANLAPRKVRHLEQMAMADRREAVASDATLANTERSRAEESVSRPTIMGSESDYPVSLSELSAPELESVLHDMQKK